MAERDKSLSAFEKLGPNVQEMFQETAAWLAQIAHDHGEWGFPIAFIFMFGESFLGISVLLPGGLVLVALGMAVGASGQGLFAIVAGAVLGAIIGDSIVYWLARRYHDHIMAIWPFSKHTELVDQGKRFFRRWGVGAIFLARLMGPVRGAIPVAAGLSHLNFWVFQSANALSAALQVALLLLPGMAVFGHLLK